MKWRVCKVVTEYHYFVVYAKSEEEAMDIVSDHDEYYCDSDDCTTHVAVVGASEVKE